MCKTANLGDSLPKRMDIAKLLLLQSTPPKKKYHHTRRGMFWKNVWFRCKLPKVTTKTTPNLQIPDLRSMNRSPSPFSLVQHQHLDVFASLVPRAWFVATDVLSQTIFKKNMAYFRENGAREEGVG